MIDALVVIFGLTLVGGGIRAIHNRYTRHDYGESVGSRAMSLGILWIVLGLIAILGVVFDIRIFRQLVELLVRSGG